MTEQPPQHTPRYAIYYTPPDESALAGFGAAWLGWDAAQGCERMHPQINDLPLTISQVTETPRKYGLHGTLKPPFYLAEGRSEAELITALRDTARDLRPAQMQGLDLAQLGRFLALTVRGDTADLAHIAGSLVEGLDRFRAPPTQSEIARRHPAHLSETQRAHLDRWGYPYVFDQFKFHITLTGKLPKSEAAATRAILDPILAPLLPTPFEVRQVTLLRSDAQGRFAHMLRVPLGG